MQSNTWLQGNNAPRSEECDLIQSGLLKGASEILVALDEESPGNGSSSSEVVAVRCPVLLWCLFFNLCRSMFHIIEDM